MEISWIIIFLVNIIIITHFFKKVVYITLTIQRFISYKRLQTSKSISGDIKKVQKDMFTFSFCCDLMAVSFSRSLFNLAFSFSCCLAAITASSFATSSCWARHRRSYKHRCKDTPGRNKKQVIGHQQLSSKNHSQGENQLGPTTIVPKSSINFSGGVKTASHALC